MVQSMHEAVVTNVLGAVEIKVASVSTILTMEQLQCRGSECRSHLMMTWATEQPVDIILSLSTTIGFSIVPKGGSGNDERKVRGASDSW
jgi:hypothetical protein